MSNNQFARMLGLGSKQDKFLVRKSATLDLATTKPDYARILKGDSAEEKKVNHSPMAWQVRAKGLLV